MAEIVANFELNNNEISADMELSNDNNIDADFVIYSTGTTWGNIQGDIADQTDLIDLIDTKIDIEATARENNDLLLQNGISTLNDDLTAEISNRGTADGILQGNIDTLSGTVSDNYTTLDGKIGDNKTSIDNHITDKTNPHEVTKAQVGLGNVDNTSDLNKPISTATQTALDDKQNTINDLSEIRLNASNGQSAYNTIKTFGDIVTYDASSFATNLQGQKADTALQPNDDISKLNNDAGYITSADVPTVNNSTITFQKNNITVGDINLNQSNNETINFDIPTTASDVNALPDTTTINDLTTTAQQNAINSGATSNNIGQIATNTANLNSLQTTVTNNYNTLDNRITSEVSNLNSSISTEATNRQNADNNLQSQIDALVVASDVFDIVGTYAELQTYDISTVPVNDIIKVLVDSTHNNAATYYRCVENDNVKSWSYIGAEGAYYTKSEADGRFVEQTTTINGQALSNNITLTASDVGALPDSTTIGNGTLTIQKNGTTIDTFGANDTGNTTVNITVPTDTGDLTNNAGYIKDINRTDVTTALGYTPYDSTNPDGYTDNVGTVTSVNNTQPDTNGNVTISIPAAQVNSDWNASSGVAQILNKPTLSTVATSGSYNDLLDKPEIPDTSTFALKSEIPIVPTNVSAFTNDVGYLTSVPSEYVTETELESKGYLTEHQDISNLATKAEVTAKQDKLTAGEGIKLENNTISSTVQSLPIGTFIPVNATSNYVPDGCLPCDGAEYSKSQFTDLWNNYLTAETPLLPTCTYSEYQTAINTYGSCAKFGIITGEELNPDYTYIGDLSVDSSGIASNFSSSNYATVPVSFTLTPESNFYYKARVKLYADVSGGFKRCITAFYYGDTFNNNELQLSYLGDNGHIDFYFNLKHADGQGTIALLSVNEYFNEGDWVTVEYIKNGTTFTTKVTNDLGETHEATTENISVKTNTYTLARIGKGDDGTRDYYKSDIDLSSVLIKVDDVEIFNGTKSNTFKVPTIKDGSVIQQALTDSELGKSYNAGLPNITGSAWSPRLGYHDTNDASRVTGAFTISNSNGTASTNADSGYNGIKISFSAQNSNPIYGNSDTVQPNAVALRYFVVVANGQINQSMMDWSAWASSLQGKANTDLSNCTKPYIIETSDKTLMPSWYRVYSDGWCEQGGFLTGSKGYTVTFLKPFINTNYNPTVTFNYSHTGTIMNAGCTTLTTTTMEIFINDNKQGNSRPIFWKASGYIN